MQSMKDNFKKNKFKQLVQTSKNQTKKNKKQRWRKKKEREFTFFFKMLLKDIVFHYAHIGSENTG